MGRHWTYSLSRQHAGWERHATPGLRSRVCRRLALPIRHCGASRFQGDGGAAGLSPFLPDYLRARGATITPWRRIEGGKRPHHVDPLTQTGRDHDHENALHTSRPLVLALPLAARAGDPHAQHDIKAMGADTGEAAKAFADVNMKMHKDMTMEFSGNPDVDFAARHDPASSGRDRHGQGRAEIRQGPGNEETR